MVGLEARCFGPNSNGWRDSRNRNSARFSAGAPSSAPSGEAWFEMPAWLWEIRDWRRAQRRIRL